MSDASNQIPQNKSTQTAKCTTNGNLSTLLWHLVITLSWVFWATLQIIKLPKLTDMALNLELLGSWGISTPCQVGNPGLVSFTNNQWADLKVCPNILKYKWCPFVWQESTNILILEEIIFLIHQMGNVNSESAVMCDVNVKGMGKNQNEPDRLHE